MHSFKRDTELGPGTFYYFVFTTKISPDVATEALHSVMAEIVETLNFDFGENENLRFHFNLWQDDKELIAVVKNLYVYVIHILTTSLSLSLSFF